jgi:ADP-ribose pyrophosphatase
VAGRADYLALAAANPGLFANPPGAAFTILLDPGDICRAEEHVAGRLSAKGAPPEWARVGVVFKDQYLLVVRDAVRFADGSLGTYVRVVDPEPSVLGVVILPVRRGQVLLIRHFRHATRRWHLEIPRGFGSSADAQESARRELQEEIGASDVSLVDLGEMYPDTGKGNSRVALFLAFVASHGLPDSKEGIMGILPTPPPELERMIGRSAVDDGFLLAAYARAKARNLI